MKSYIVLGVGRFGKSLACSLFEMGHEVLAIDADEDLIQEISNKVTHAVTGDCMDEGVLKTLGLRNFDAAIVAIGGNTQASIMVTLLLREMGVKYIVAKAQSELHAKVLEKVGADRVVFPEHDMGVRLAQRLTSENIMDYIELSSKYSIIEIIAPDSWVGKALGKLDIRRKFGINILAIKNGDNVSISPPPSTVFYEGDILILLGDNDSVNSIKQWK